ncbi:MAG: hypothetical protein IKX58_02870, partial [Clostridia bacterium]|nr:hypothetical protein [Clostridia bacterium]
MNKINIFASAAIAAIASGAMLLFPACAEDKASEQTAAINQPTEVVTQAPTESATEEASARPTETPEPDEDTVDVLTIKTDSYYGSGTHYFRGYDINETVRFSTKKGANDDIRTIEFAGKKYELKYTRTIEYIKLNDAIVDEYEIITDNAPKSSSDIDHVELLPDGTPFGILTKPIATININECKNGEDVRKVVEEALKDEIDFSAFDEYEILEPDMERLITYYSIAWYYKKGGITYQAASLMVDEEGVVSALWMQCNADLGLDNVPDNISVDDY